MQEYSDIITQTANQLGIDPILVTAIIMQESAGDTWATRFESSYYDHERFLDPDRFAENSKVSINTEKSQQATSWGLLQIMGVVAREVGYTGKLTKLLIPERGIFWACKKLQLICHKYQKLEDIIASWNAGSPQVIDSTGKYLNQAYVDAVMANINSISKGGING